MIECYYKTCPNHSNHEFPDDGPFCYETKCLRTEEEINMLAAERRKELIEIHNFFDLNIK